MRKIKNIEKEHQYLEPIKEVFVPIFLKTYWYAKGKNLHCEILQRIPFLGGNLHQN